MKLDFRQSIDKINRTPILLGLLVGAAMIMSACAVGLQGKSSNFSPDDKTLLQKYRGIHGGVLYFDASGHPKRYVTMQTQSGRMWHATMAGFSPGGAGQLTFTDAMSIPKTIRVVWRAGDVKERKDKKGHADYHLMGFDGGIILGDYTVPLAERVPDEVLDYIREHGGALRLKIRLEDDGVLIGWDVEEHVPKPNWQPKDGARNYIRHSLPGGDFREAQVFNGKIIDPGWEK